MKATVVLEIEVPDKISGKIVTQKEISSAVVRCLEFGVDDANSLTNDFGCRSTFLDSKIKVISATTNSLVK